MHNRLCMCSTEEWNYQRGAGWWVRAIDCDCWERFIDGEWRRTDKSQSIWMNNSDAYPCTAPHTLSIYIPHVAIITIIESNAEFDTIFEIIDRFCNNIISYNNIRWKRRDEKNNKNLFGLSISAVNTKHSHTHTLEHMHKEDIRRKTCTTPLAEYFVWKSMMVKWTVVLPGVRSMYSRTKR